MAASGVGWVTWWRMGVVAVLAATILGRLRRVLEQRLAGAEPGRFLRFVRWLDVADRWDAGAGAPAG